MSFRATEGYFLKNGKPHFLASGEIHYFRIDRKLWEKHLLLLKQSGANGTSTYIPWDWHEYEEGRFDFNGETHPARDIVGYIELCAKIGLDLIVKPGPYILAEYVHHGLPAWLVRRGIKNALACDERGNIIAPDRMSYLSEEFLKYVFIWYDHVMPIIARYQDGIKRPIVMMQVCNEVGVFQWLSGKIDYHPSVLNLYLAFLRGKYESIEMLNNKYGTSYSSFDDVKPPCGPIENRIEYRLYVDFHLFYRHYFALYLETLVHRIRSYGITLQLVHNIPGWIYGSASELPMLVSTYADVLKRLPEIAFGLDHIPEYISFRNAHADLACNKILGAVQPGGSTWAAEYQAGSREHHVKNDPRDMELFYFASLGHGLKGLNYYMFSQGENYVGKGIYGRKFYFQTPLNVEARKSQLYPVVKKMNQFILREGMDFLKSKTRADICVGLYQPYFHTFLTSTQLSMDRKLNVEKLGLHLDPKFVREELLFNGVLRALQTLNLNYDIKDLQEQHPDVLLKYRQLWVVTTEWMDAKTQKFLLSFVEKGGQLVILPAIPTLDEYLYGCPILQEGLNIQAAQKIATNRVNAFGLDGVYTPTNTVQISEINDGEVIATTESGEICGFRKNVGKGTVTALGFAIGYSSEDHLDLYRRIARLDKVRQDATVSDPDIQIVLRKGQKHHYLFLFNFHNRRKTFTVDSKRYSLRPLGWQIVKKKVTQ